MMMCLIKINTSKQLADIFTKPLAYAQVIGCIRGILGDPDAMRHTKVHALQARHSAGPGDSSSFADSMIESRRPFGGGVCTQVHGSPEAISSSVRASESVTLSGTAGEPSPSGLKSHGATWPCLVLLSL
jgi:hypothetical protein